MVIKILADILLLIVNIEPIVHLPKYLAAIIFGVYQGVFCGMAHIGFSLESSRKGRTILDFLTKWTLYGLLVLHLMEWLLRHTFRFLLKGGVTSLGLAVLVWFGVFLLFYFPQVRKPLYKVFSWAPFYKAKIKKGREYREAVEYFRSHKVAAISVEEREIRFYDAREPQLEQDVLEVSYDNGHTEGSFPEATLPPVHTIYFDFRQGPLECATYARVLSKALKLKKYMHVSAAESYTYTTTSYDVVHVSSINGHVSAQPGTKSNTTITRKCETYDWRFYLSGK